MFSRPQPQFREGRRGTLEGCDFLCLSDIKVDPQRTTLSLPQVSKSLPAFFSQCVVPFLGAQLHLLLSAVGVEE